MSSRNSHIIKTSTLTVIGITIAVISSKLISKYGVQGTLRLLWEGDHLPPEIREAMDELDDAEETEIPRVITKIDEIELALRRIFSSSNGNNSNYCTTTDTKSNIQYKKEILNGLPPLALSTFKRDLSVVSHDVDRIAADIDSVRSHGDEDVALRKKKLSNLIVSSMKRVDHIMELFS